MGHRSPWTTTTGGDGSYRFNGQTLYPGTYTVTVSNPGGYVFSPQYQGETMRWTAMWTRPAWRPP